MDIGFEILLFLHLGALVLGGATLVGMPLVMRQMQAAPTEGRAGYSAIMRRLGVNARIALGTLVVTGILMVWVRYGGVEGMSPWFWVKMALVVVIIVVMILGIALPPARANPRLFGWITRLAFFGVVLSAVLAFN